MNNSQIFRKTLTQCRPAMLAAVESKNSDDSERVVDTVVAKLQARNYQLVGLRQRELDTSVNRCAVRLQSIAAGTFHRMTQDLGTGSTSCNIDTEALETLAEQQKKEVAPGVDLVIVNRFGKREAQGAGFCSVFEKAITLDIPVLTIVSSIFLTQWETYGEELVTTLPSKEAKILSWVEAVAGTKKTSSLVGVD